MVQSNKEYTRWKTDLSETSVYRHHWELLRAPWNFPYNTIVLRELRGALIGPPEMPVSRTAVSLVGVVFVNTMVFCVEY